MFIISPIFLLIDLLVPIILVWVGECTVLDHRLTSILAFIGGSLFTLVYFPIIGDTTPLTTVLTVLVVSLAGIGIYKFLR